MAHAMEEEELSDVEEFDEDLHCLGVVGVTQGEPKANKPKAQPEEETTDAQQSITSVLGKRKRSDYLPDSPSLPEPAQKRR